MTGRKNEGEDLKSLANIDRTVHEPARLMILACLYVLDSADFTFLSRQTELSGGNLSSHLSKLESAGYVEVEKKFLGKRPHTMLRLSQRGREAFRLYRRHILEVLRGLPD
jgi:DNA-binding transcriptional ArsR family regulator